MNTSKHTPGPWHWVGTQGSPNRKAYLAHSCDDSPTSWVGVSLNGFTDNEADANLIAAAPDLFDALEMVPIHRLGETPEAFIERFKSWYRETRNPAIEKAAGK